MLCGRCERIGYGPGSSAPRESRCERAPDPPADAGPDERGDDVDGQRAARAYVSIPAAVDQSTPVKRTTVLLAFAPSSAAMTLASTVSAHSLLVRPGSDS